VTVVTTAPIPLALGMASGFEWIIIATIGFLLFGKRLLVTAKSFEPADDPLGVGRLLLLAALAVLTLAVLQALLH
jgi:hypothetical protein